MTRVAACAAFLVLLGDTSNQLTADGWSPLVAVSHSEKLCRLHDSLSALIASTVLHVTADGNKMKTRAA